MPWHTIFYHYLYQDFYEPVWPNVAASITIGLWIIWRNRAHIDRLEHRIKHQIGLHASLVSSEMDKVHARLSELHSSRHSSTRDSNSGPELSAREETNRIGPTAG